MRWRCLAVCTFVLAALAFNGSARAQSYPSGPVQIIVPFAKGGSADTFARVIADGLTKELGQPVTVDNRPGGGGSVGLQSVTQAAPDGRTLLLGQTGEIVIQPYLMKQAGPRPEPVALVADMPLAIVVSSTAPYSKLSDLIAAARSSRRGLSAAMPGRYTPGDLATELFRIRTSANLATVPFPGGGPSLDAVAEGLVDLYFSTLTSAMPQMRAGKVKLLAVTSAERSPAVPDVPTVQESGVRRFAVTQWAGVFTPRGTPADIVDRLNRDINKVLAGPEVGKRLASEGAKITPMSATQFGDFIKADAKIYERFLTAELCSEFVVESCSGGGEFSR